MLCVSWSIPSNTFATLRPLHLSSALNSFVGRPKGTAYSVRCENLSGSTPPQGYSRAGRPRPKVQETFIPSFLLPGSPPLWSAVPIPGHPKGGGRPGHPTAHLVERRTTLTDHGNPYRRDTEGWLPRLFYEPHGPLPFSRPLLGAPSRKANQRPANEPCLTRQRYSSYREDCLCSPARDLPSVFIMGFSISQVRPQ